MAISKGIIDRLGGKIWVESELGKGAAFYFTIPKERHVETTKEEKVEKVIK